MQEKSTISIWFAALCTQRVPGPSPPFPENKNKPIRNAKFELFLLVYNRILGRIFGQPGRNAEFAKKVDFHSCFSRTLGFINYCTSNQS